MSIDNYGVHGVVANVLETRKEKVFIVQKGQTESSEVHTIRRKEEDGFIENDIVGFIVSAHKRYRGSENRLTE